MSDEILWSGLSILCSPEIYKTPVYGVDYVNVSTKQVFKVDSCKIFLSYIPLINRHLLGMIDIRNLPTLTSLMRVELKKDVELGHYFHL